MNYIYAPNRTETVKALLSEFGAIRLPRFDGMNFRKLGKIVTFTPGDTIINWGAHVPPIEGVNVLNSNIIYGSQLSVNTNRVSHYMRNIGIIVISVEQFADLGNYYKCLQTVSEGGAIKNGELVAYKEFEGYGTRCYRFTKQYKLHVFNNEAILVGTKETVKNADKRYRYNYENKDIPGKVILAAVEYAKLLKLDFAVINVGTVDNSVIIRKVITGPELDSEHTLLYSKYIRNWMDVSKMQLE